MLEYLAKAFPDLRPVVAANPAIPAVLREQVLQMGANDLPNVSPASPHQRHGRIRHEPSEDRGNRVPAHGINRGLQ